MNYFVIEQTTQRATPFLNLDAGGGHLAGPDPAAERISLSVSAKSNIHDEPAMADFHKVPYPAMSDLLRNAIDGIGAKGFEWIPATVSVGDQSWDYSIMHVLSWVDCIDMERSNIDLNRLDKIKKINSLELRSDIVDKLKAEGVQIFKPVNYMMTIMSEAVAAALAAAGGTGYKLFPVDEWNSKVGLKL